MDNSREYVLMSTAAMKFLPNHKWANGDLAYIEWAIPSTPYEPPYKGIAMYLADTHFFGGDGLGFLAPNHIIYFFPTAPSTNPVPLLRQDQLQAMVKGNNTRELLMRFADWVEKETNYRRESMEQLWLAFVMSELYQKNGTVLNGNEG